MSEPQIVLERDAQLGENPVWDDRTGTLLWLDIQRGEVHRFDPASGEDRVTATLPGEVGAAVLTEGQDLLLGVDDRLMRLTESTGACKPISEVSGDVRFNDATCDTAGRLLIGTLARDGDPRAALYALRGGRLEPLVPGLVLSNGVDLDPSGSMLYLADTAGERVLAAPYDPASGTVGEPRVLVDLADAPGRPDGLTVDADGHIWIAMARGRQVRCISARGLLVDVIDLPAHAVTSVTFGGSALGDLYVTTGTFAATGEDLTRFPGTGSLWRIGGLGPGAPARRYAEG